MNGWKKVLGCVLLIRISCTLQLPDASHEGLSPKPDLSVPEVPASTGTFMVATPTGDLAESAVASQVAAETANVGHAEQIIGAKLVLG